MIYILVNLGVDSKKSKFLGVEDQESTKESTLLKEYCDDFDSSMTYQLIQFTKEIDLDLFAVQFVNPSVCYIITTVGGDK